MANLKTRNEINDNFKWNIEKMFSDQKNWEDDLSKALSLSENFIKFSGNILSSSSTLLDSLEMKDLIWRLLEKVFVYARMKKDEDNTNELYQSMCDKANVAISTVSTNTSFFIPEILENNIDLVKEYISKDPLLKTYEFYLLNLFREKDHVLSKSEEALVANFSQIFSSTNDIFTMLNNGDIQFGTIKDEEDTTVTLTHGNYIKYMESTNRDVRKAAYTAMYASYKALINTIATTYNYNTKTDVVLAKIRKYPSALEASLSSDNIQKEVYTNLISQVNEALPSLHKYMETRKRLLHLDELKMHDIYVPLITLPKKEFLFNDAVSIMIDSLSPLGDEYTSIAKKGVESGWIDIYENKGKTSGAYSFGSYDSMPYILLNYTNTLKDVFTLVHEMGHSMHSFYTRKAQPFIYGGHSIFTAEVASTVNEKLLLSHLTKECNDIEMKKYLLNFHIEEFRTTLFRQTMFAEFELITHETLETGGTLTADSMCSEYNSLNKKYFGDPLSEDEYIKYEWSRIPHFYRAFYVYKYATGFSAATAISHKILTEGGIAQKNYIEFLKSGESGHPIDLLEIAGVNMSTKKPVSDAMNVFKLLVDEFDEITR